MSLQTLGIEGLFSPSVYSVHTAVHALKLQRTAYSVFQEKLKFIIVPYSLKTTPCFMRGNTVLVFY